MSAVPEQILGASSANDADPQETHEWLDALQGVLNAEGTERAAFLIDKQIEYARVNGVTQPFHAETPYINTIPVEQQARIPGDQDIEHRIRSYTRWNAMAMVLRANKHTNVGGHISSFASAATLYDVGYNHFWRAPSEQSGGDLVFVQGHSAPGVYSRAFLLGRLTPEQLDSFRQEVDGKGISSYPHPWLMPDFWQFPTVSMGLLMKRMMECVDGEYQTFKAKDGAYVREHFFNTPELKAMVADWSDDDIWRLNRGGHDPHKVYAAYKAASEHKGQPTLILAKTIKGYGMGDAGQAMNVAHQQKKMPVDAIRAFRDQFNIPVADDKLEEVPYLTFPEGSKELEYMRKARMDLGGYLPARRMKAEALKVPELSAFEALLKATGEGREVSTTMAFVRILNTLLKDKQVGKHVVPIVPDESRTFGMEGLFRQVGIWNQEGQKYVPEDHDQLMFYKESQTGQVLQEGINEAGAMCDWIAAATSYSTHGVQMIPFYIYYSMFGIQRIGDLCWAAADMRSRGFLLGGTAGRTTLNGEGLQHEDGHSHVFHAVIPNCISYDPTFQYELAVIMQDGLRRMYAEQEDVYYYLTVMNENYEHPEMPAGVERDIVQGMYQFRKGVENSNAPRVQLLGSGTIFREVIAAADLLKKDWGVESDLWSCPSFTELAREGQEVERHNLLNPTGTQRESFVAQKLKGVRGPVIASTDYIRAFAEQIRPFVPRRYVVLGTDGFGRSDTREKLRHFFEVDRYWVTVAALKALADEGAIGREKVAEAIKKYNLDPNKPNPMSV